jgi:hypothetical protein
VLEGGDAAAPLEFVAKAGEGAAPGTAARACAAELLARWPPPHDGSVAGRLHASLVPRAVAALRQGRRFGPALAGLAGAADLLAGGAPLIADPSNGARSRASPGNPAFRHVIPARARGGYNARLMSAPRPHRTCIPRTPRPACPTSRTKPPALARPLDWVGMDRIAVPVRIHDADGTTVQVAAEVDVAVDLKDGDARGIHMSRLYLQLQQAFASEAITPPGLRRVLQGFVDSQQGLSTRARLHIRYEHLLQRPALASGHLGWKRYPVSIDAELADGHLQLTLGFAVEYSSTCPASAASRASATPIASPTISPPRARSPRRSCASGWNPNAAWPRRRTRSAAAPMCAWLAPRVRRTPAAAARRCGGSGASARRCRPP